MQDIESIELTKDLFEEQPEKCRALFPTDGRSLEPKWAQRVIEYDPSEIFERFRYNKVNCKTRYNFPNFNEMFPNREGECNCGCKRETKKEYFNNECRSVAMGVFTVLSGTASYITFLLNTYYGNNICRMCREEGGTDLGVDLDHIHPIREGGGFCWLNNFQLLCHNHHVVKTREDFGWKPLTRKTNKYRRKGTYDESQIKRRGPRKKKTNDDTRKDDREGEGLV